MCTRGCYIGQIHTYCQGTCFHHIEDYRASKICLPSMQGKSSATHLSKISGTLSLGSSTAGQGEEALLEMLQREVQPPMLIYMQKMQC